MAIRHALVVPLTVLALAAVAPCAAPASAQLSRPQVLALKRCQTTVNLQSQLFLRTKLKNLAACAQAIVTLHYGAGTQAAVAGVEARCGMLYAGIRTASTLFIDRVIAACGPVHDLVLVDDQLGFVEMLNAAAPYLPGDPPLDSLATLAGLICGTVEAFADGTALVAMPAAAGAMFGHFGAPHLDARCLVPTDSPGLGSSGAGLSTGPGLQPPTPPIQQD
jgi:hypothetical protein